MSGGHFSHSVRVSRSALIGTLALGLLTAPSAVAFEAFDGRLQMHGYFESTMRALNADYSEDWDVAQWYMIFNLEFEMDLVQDRIGPIDLLSAYVRAEVRYDCVYSHGCGMFRSMNAYGDRSKSLPRRLQNSERLRHAGRIRIPRDQTIPARLSGTSTDPLNNFTNPTLSLFSNGAGGDGVGPLEDCEFVNLCPYFAGEDGVTVDSASPVSGPAGSSAAPGVMVGSQVVTDLFPFSDNPFEEMERIGDMSEFRWFAFDSVTGGASGGGPWLPKNFFQTNATLARMANPFDDRVGSYGLQASTYTSYLVAAEAFINSQNLDESIYGPPGSDIRLAQVVEAAANGEDQNADGFVFGSEDANGNGWLDPGEDANGNMVLDYYEDLNANGNSSTNAAMNDTLAAANAATEDMGAYVVVGAGRLPYRPVPEFREVGARNAMGDLILGNNRLDLLEDLNGNSVLDLLEDLNGNGMLDPGEDLNGDGILQTEDLNGDGILQTEDTNGNGVLDPGEDLPKRAKPGDARGLFIPSPALAQHLNKGDLTSIEKSFNFREAERAWNRGESQRDEKELKEAYLDVELLDNRLWLRLGKQQIVWGKTELFRTTDQFNPSDAALASLPSLEESRIALWSARAVYSFYEVGPLDDVRFELAINFDDYQSIDLGACGEAYTVNLVCALTFGSFAHGLFGIGLVGFDEPPDPWSSLKGIEIGGRLEWRYDRFSFALMDFWGYSDLPTLELITTYTRNVDPRSGRPREMFGSALNAENPTRDIYNVDPSMNPFNAVDPATISQIGKQGICVTGQEEACLTPGEALTRASTAQQLYAFVCAGTVGFSALDPTACSLNVFGSQGLIVEAPPITTAQGIGLLLAGSPDTVITLAYTVPILAGTTQADLFPSPINEDRNGNGRLDDDPSHPDYNRNADPNDPPEIDLNMDGQLSQGGRGGLILPFVQLQAAVTDYGSTTDADQRHNPNVNGTLPGTGCVDPTVSGPAATMANNQQCGSVGSGLIQSLSVILPAGQGQGLGATLSPEQEALLGCGPFWGTQCDNSGVDLLNTEGSALFQSWPGVEGTTLPFANVGNGGPADLFRLFHTNERNDARTSFIDQPGTRNWFFSPSDRDPISDFAVNGAPHSVGPVCTTANFGGAIYDGSGGSDYANGNQDVLPGCRNKWRRRPVFEAIAQGAMDANGDGVIDQEQRQNLLSMNFFGQDRNCAQIIAQQGDVTGGDCEYLQDWMVALDDITLKGTSGPDAADAPRDHRSWDYVKDGDPDALGVGSNAPVLSSVFINNQPGLATYQLTTPTRVPDYFYRRPTFSGLDPFPLYRDCTDFPESDVQAAGGSQFVPCGKGGHPLTGQPFANEMAALSWNFLVLLVDLDVSANDPESPLFRARAQAPYCLDNTMGGQLDCKTDYEIAQQVYFDPDNCSLVSPELCSGFRALMGSVGLQRNIRRAGGNGIHGRRTMIWQSGGEALISYQKRNVLGFSMDFAEDVSKTNFSIESTWLEGVPVGNNNKYSGLDRVDQFNLTVSVDRPTFINFLNANRTFFFNAQMFAGYVSGWNPGMTAAGPWSFLGTFAVGTGYFQDRLTPSFVTVYDFNNQAGAVLTSISYRFTQNFSAAFGLAFFYGQPDLIDQAVGGLAPAGNKSTLAPDDLYRSGRDGGLAIVKDRDELWARVRYTF